jgi:hypothetical protein
VGIATGYGLDSRDSIPDRSKIFLLSIASRPAVKPTQPPIQWVPRALSLEVKLITHLHLVPKLRMMQQYVLMT